MNTLFKHLILFITTIIFTIIANAEQRQESPSFTQKAKEILQLTISHVPDLKNSVPDRQITKWLDEITQSLENLTDEDFQKEETILFSGEVKDIILLLETRRTFRYMLWAEKKLRNCSQHDYSKLSQEELFDLYKSLSDINLVLIPENILAREIAGQLASIYDHLDSSYKPEARLESIRRNVDKRLAEKMKFRRRKTLDDF